MGGHVACGMENSFMLLFDVSPYICVCTVSKLYWALENMKYGNSLSYCNIKRLDWRYKGMQVVTAANTQCQPSTFVE